MSEVIKISTHSDGKPTENVVAKIGFEASLKNAARNKDNSDVSVLNLYKRAIADNKGISLPTNHQTYFLTKLRRIRKYEKEKEKKGIDQQRKPALNTIDIASSPMSPNISCTPLKKSADSINKTQKKNAYKPTLIRTSVQKRSNMRFVCRGSATPTCSWSVSSQVVKVIIIWDHFTVSLNLILFIKFVFETIMK